MPIPDHALECRCRGAMSLVGGNGIGIGALDAPAPLPAGEGARDADFRTRREIGAQCLELDASTVDDGERLAMFEHASIDLLIASQMHVRAPCRE